jgi:hypothetical protein
MSQNSGQPGNVNRIRNHIDNFGDPYVVQAGPEEKRVCTECSAIYIGQRWYLKDQAEKEKLRTENVHLTVCPACRKIHDKAPGGVVHLSGNFIREHKEDIMNLIHNEGDRAKAVNPLERIMGIEGNDGDFSIMTTNEKLAQRIGRALHKAYSGAVAYKWSGDNKLVRVSWQRD